MKKTLFTVLFVALAAVSASAQNMFLKPMVGGTLSTLTGDIDHAKMKFGVVGGAEFGYMLSPEFAVTAGALVSMQGASADDDVFTKDFKTTLTYLNIPIMANVYITDGLAVKLGLQPGLNLSAKYKYDASVAGYEGSSEGDIDDVKSFDLALPIGVSYEINNFVIDGRYNFGLSKVFETGDNKHSVFQITLGYKFSM